MAKISLKDYQELETIDRLYSFNSLLDILLNVEGFLDDMNIYAYDKNWYRGEVVSGPTISRYWVKIILKFDHKYMPNPEVIKVLEKVGCTVTYEEGKIEVHKPTNHFQNINQNQYMSIETKKEIKDVWYIELRIPKKLIYNNIDIDGDKYEDEVDFDAFDAENAEEDSME